jgi:hypothetical protein
MAKQFNPFPEVASAYGSPMGRREDNPANLIGVRRLHCRHQGGGDGYDKGGAYWGTPSNVYAVWGHLAGDIIVTYVRASSRQNAIDKVRAGNI